MATVSRTRSETTSRRGSDDGPPGRLVVEADRQSRGQRGGQPPHGRRVPARRPLPGVRGALTPLSGGGGGEGRVVERMHGCSLGMDGTGAARDWNVRGPGGRLVLPGGWNGDGEPLGDGQDGGDARCDERRAICGLLVVVVAHGGCPDSPAVRVRRPSAVRGPYQRSRTCATRAGHTPRRLPAARLSRAGGRPPGTRGSRGRARRARRSRARRSTGPPAGRGTGAA